MNHLFRLLQFFFFQNRIDSNINAGIIQMGMFYQCFNIFQRVYSRCTGKFGCTDIYGIRSVIDGFNSALQDFCRGEKFYLTLLYHSISLML